MPGSYAWVFKAPRADLYTFGARKVGTHFAGPTWQDTADASSVVGRAIQNVPAPTSEGLPPAIPWLLLETRSVTSAASGNPGAFARTSFVRHLFTLGGLAPTGGCDATTAGQEWGVRYAALYEFYTPSSSDRADLTTGLA